MLGKRSSFEKEKPESTKAQTMNSYGNNWWIRDKDTNGTESKVKWNTMEHNGVSFPENYKKHNAPIYYMGKQIEVSKFQEELATYWTQTLGTDWLKNSYYKKNFSKIFLKTFVEKPLKFVNEDDSTTIDRTSKIK
jgi:DNA topoisomerase-1